MFTRQVRQNLKSATVNITNAPQRSFRLLSRSFRRETWLCSADIQGPLSVNLPELPIRNLSWSNVLAKQILGKRQIPSVLFKFYDFILGRDWSTETPLSGVCLPSFFDWQVGSKRSHGQVEPFLADRLFFHFFRLGRLQLGTLICLCNVPQRIHFHLCF